MALEPGSKRGLGRDPSGLDIDTNQPRGLRPAESGHVLDVGPKKPLGAPLLKRVLVMAEQTLHPAVNLRAPATGEPHTLRGGKKCLDLNQTQLLGSKHADHPSSACPFQPLQAHLALESTPPLRLILRWTRVCVDPARISCYCKKVPQERARSCVLTKGAYGQLLRQQWGELVPGSGEVNRPDRSPN